MFVRIYICCFCRTLIQAGTTPEERDNFGRYLITNSESTHSQSAEEEEEEEEGMKHSDSEAPFIGFGYDSFREIHGKDAEGAFTYWSTRARNRCVNIYVNVCQLRELSLVTLSLLYISIIDNLI
jgi:hypothetical protein